MVTIGIIGDGPTAEVHRDRYGEIETVESVEQVNVNESTRLKGVLDTVDGIDVCSSPSTHRSVIETALARDVDVLCAPPIGGNMREAEAITDAAAASEATVLAGHVSRFAPGHVAVTDSVRDGSVGQSGVIRICRTIPERTADEWHDWYADDGNTGNLLTDFGLHDFDYLRWMIGDVERMYTRVRDDDEIEHAVTLVRFSTGAAAHVETIRGPFPNLNYRVEMDIAGDDGLVQYDTAQAAGFDCVNLDGNADIPYAEPPLTDGNGFDGYAHMLSHFVSCVRGDERPRVTAEDGARALQLSTAARRSVELGRPVTLKEVVS